MIKSKHIDRIVILLVLAALAAIGVLTVLLHGREDAGMAQDYEATLFSTEEPMTVNVLIDEEDWQDLLDTALTETYYCCDVEINGVTYYNVGIRAKGNTSLTSVAASDSDRYSFKIQFDEYTDGQTCQGLDKLVLNNNYADATMMKEAVTYDMFAYLGADASLYQYANISVNGEYWGVYLALEAVEESFAMRNYGTNYGQLYKPENMNMDGGKAGGGQMPETDGQPPFDLPDAAGDRAPAEHGEARDTEGPSSPENNQPENDASQNTTSNEPTARGAARSALESPSKRGGMGGGPGGMGASGSTTLNYIDDDLDSYAEIWDASVFDSTDSDHKRVVTALQKISQGEDLETYLDVDNMLRYMAVQTFVVNLDSLTGNMAHNYYLYEKNGQLNLIPWDYNLAFGGFQSGDASSMINFPIDTPFSGVSLEDRQFFKALLEDPEYLDQYHTYLKMLVEEYVVGGRFDTLYHTIRDQIDELVSTDPTAFYSYEEYDTAAQMLYQTVHLRAESISGQLDGSIPSTTDGQSENPDLLVDASYLDLSVMGTQMGNMGGFPGQNEIADPQEQTGSSPAHEEASGAEPEATPSADGLSADAPGETLQPLAGTEPSDPPSAPNAGGESLPASAETEDPGQADSAANPWEQGQQGGPPQIATMGNAEISSASQTSQVILLSACMALMLLALFAAIKFRRK